MKFRELQPRRPSAALPGAGGANSPVSRYPEAANVVYRFGVHLRGTDPPVWRLIDVPADYREPFAETLKLWSAAEEVG